MSSLNNVIVEISVILGKATMPIHRLLKMGRGAVIELDASVEDSVWIYANNFLIARGQVMVSGENVAVTITEDLRASET